MNNMEAWITWSNQTVFFNWKFYIYTYKTKSTLQMLSWKWVTFLNYDLIMKDKNHIFIKN